MQLFMIVLTDKQSAASNLGAEVKSSCTKHPIGTALYKKENSAFSLNIGTEEFIVSVDYTWHHC